MLRVTDRIPAPDSDWSGDAPDPGSSSAPYRIYNIGNNNPVELMDFIARIEEATGCKAQKNFVPAQPGDVPITFADTTDLLVDVGFKPETPIDQGIANFVAWYRDYYEL